MFGVREPTDNALVLAERMADKLLATLPVTPVSAVGINFGFLIDEPSDYLAAVFRLSDLARLAERELLIEETRIVRRMPYEDRSYNLTMTLGDDGKVRFNANYHQPVEGPENARAAISDKPLAYRAHTTSVITDLYEAEPGDRNA